MGLLIVVLFVLAGCARWSKDTETARSDFLPAPRQSLDSVLVKTVLVRFPHRKLDRLQSIWSSVDESLFDLELRELLAKNGLRAGMIVGELPLVIREQIEETSERQTVDALEHAGLAADADNKTRELQCRAGRRKDLIVRREVNDTLTVFTTLDGKSVTGQTYQSPAVLFDLRAIPHGDGQATIELTPEIQHGAQRNSFVTTEFGMRPEMRRSQQTWEELKLSAKLSPGQILVITSSQPHKALGSAFFTTKTAEMTDEYVVLLVRLGETQLDELFAPEEIDLAKSMSER